MSNRTRNAQIAAKDATKPAAKADKKGAPEAKTPATPAAPVETTPVAEETTPNADEEAPKLSPKALELAQKITAGGPITVESLAADLQAMVQSVVKEDRAARGQTRKEKAQEKRKAALLVDPYCSKPGVKVEDFALVALGDVKELDALGRMNALLDYAEYLGFGDPMIETLERSLQRQIERSLGGTFYHAVFIPQDVLDQWNRDRFDYGQNLKDADAVRAALVEAMPKVEAFKAKIAKKEAEEKKAAAAK